MAVASVRALDVVFHTYGDDLEQVHVIYSVFGEVADHG